VLRTDIAGAPGQARAQPEGANLGSGSTKASSSPYQSTASCAPRRRRELDQISSCRRSCVVEGYVAAVRSTHGQSGCAKACRCPGERFLAAGFGDAAVGSSAWLGALQIATLTAIGEPSSLQLWLADPASHGGAVAGFSSCQGDSGGPVFEWSGGRFRSRRRVELVQRPQHERGLWWH
jgi:hypothetical protein